MLYCVILCCVSKYTKFYKLNFQLCLTNEYTRTSFYCVILCYTGMTSKNTMSSYAHLSPSCVKVLLTDGTQEDWLVDHQNAKHQQRPRKLILSWRKTWGRVGYCLTRGRGLRQSPKVAIHRDMILTSDLLQDIPSLPSWRSAVWHLGR